MKIYTSYKCKTCKKEFVLLTEDAEEHKKVGKYLVCNYCSSQRVAEENTADSLKECMKERVYKRVHGKVHQIK